ncbi:hypothetical protein TVAG_141660 [Trichomonas vaginalis G3]|uniref:Uncharacterized protein n=1 Tax=Trichomonas vaginalis (strain ATCC PRA-98 / G3) TaxID=412133 RepID=A2GYY9_TRIV3|nr:hypothetical protein TVAG_141660 [Trichomonas vaginalis G3]|eukprot:XP_001290559.1 hypothetical protein [Trichomonas vaginalis G3]
MVNCLVKSFWHSESFHPTGKKFPDNWKKISRQLEKIFLLFVRKPFKFSKIENFLVELQKKIFHPTEKNFPSDRKKFSIRQEKIFHPTGKIFPSNRKNSSIRQEKIFLPTGHKRMTDVPLPECLPKPEEPTAPAPQQTKTKTLYFSSLTFYNLNFVRVDMNSERSMRVLYDFVLLP